MPVYFIIQEQARDEVMLARYAEKARSVPSTGRVLAVDAAPAVIEGAWHGDRAVIIEFEDESAFRAWYDSPE